LRNDLIHGSTPHAEALKGKNMKILVIGATGYIGSAVAEALAAAGRQVLGLSRSAASDARLAAFGIEPVRGALDEPGRLAQLTAGVDAVVWAATANREDVDAPAIDATLAELVGTRKTFLYTSGTWVHGATHGAVADEESLLAPAAIVAWRVAVERRVLATPGIRAIVIRPGIVYGSGGGIPALLTASVREHGAVRFVGNGENRWAVVFRADLAELYVRALADAPAGSVFIGAQGTSDRVLDLARAASTGQGCGGHVVAWPIEQARRELGAFADALALDQRVSSARAHRLLGWNPVGPSILDELSRGSYANAARTAGGWS
jgi:nucleoside-diphosphate-sugar epimerase